MGKVRIRKITFFKTLLAAAAFCAALIQCSDEGLTLASANTLAINSSLATSTSSLGGCPTCTYVVPANVGLIDGQKLNLQPGSVICLNAAFKYGRLRFINLKGTAGNPIKIVNCGGQVVINAPGQYYAMKTESSQYFKITGGSIASSYGIKLTGSQLGLTLDYLSTNFEVDHIEVASTSFAGIMAKTDPSCDNATIRGNFTMRDVSLHDNFVHETVGEAFYVGNSSYENGVSTSCGTRYPHAIEGIKIYNNLVQKSGWDGIQLGSATKGAEIYNNRIESYATSNTVNQNSGIQIGEGTGGLCYGNLVKQGSGNAVTVLGLGDNVIHDNILVKAGNYGIFCDTRYTPGTGFAFLNNTIIDSHNDGIRISAKLPLNVIMNNIIVNPGSYNTYQTDNTSRTGNDAYVYVMSSLVKVQLANNYFTQAISTVKFTSPSTFIYTLTGGSPVINTGGLITNYNIAKDFYQQTRVKGGVVDIGAAEY